MAKVAREHSEHSPLTSTSLPWSRRQWAARKWCHHRPCPGLPSCAYAVNTTSPGIFTCSIDSFTLHCLTIAMTRCKQELPRFWAAAGWTWSSSHHSPPVVALPNFYLLSSLLLIPLPPSMTSLLFLLCPCSYHISIQTFLLKPTVGWLAPSLFAFPHRFYFETILWACYLLNSFQVLLSETAAFFLEVDRSIAPSCMLNSSLSLKHRFW